MTPINIKKVRVPSFTIEYPETLQYGNSVVIGLMGDVTDIHGKDNHDGTQDATYTITIEHMTIDKVIGEERTTMVDSGKEMNAKGLMSYAYKSAMKTGESKHSLYQLGLEAAKEAIRNHEETIIGYPKE